MAGEVDLAQFAPKTGALDLAAFAPKEPPRTAIGEIVTAVKRGALVGLPQMAGEALKYTSSAGNPVYDFGKSIADAAIARGEQPSLTLRPDEHNVVTNALAAGAEMVPSIAAPVAVGMGALAALPALPAAAGAGLIAAGAAAPFAAQAGQQTLEKAEKQHIPEDQATTAARLNAGLTFGTQTALGLVGGKIFGRFGGIFGDIVKKDGAELGEQVLAELTGRAPIAKAFAKSLPGSTAEAVAAGAGQAAGSAAIEKSYGIDTHDPMAAALESVPTMLGLSAIMAPLGLAGRAVHANALAKRAEALSSKDTAPQIRDQLATQYFTELNKVDPAAAKEFAKNAQIAIETGQPLEIDPGLFQQGAVKRPVLAQPTLALPSPYDFVGGPGGVGRDAGAVRAAVPGEPAPAEAQRLLAGPPNNPALARPGLPPQATEAHGPNAAELIAAQRDRARAAEENRKALVDTHAHVIDELRAAGVEPTRAMSFPQFRDAMAAEAKKAGLKADDLTPADYRDMWEKHQADVMHQNFTKAQVHAFELAEQNKPKAGEEAKPKSALAVALEDALRHQQVEEAFKAHTAEHERQLDALQNVGRGTRLAEAAARGEVPAAAKTLPNKSEDLVASLRSVKADDQGMPPKLMKELTEKVGGKKSLEDQLVALKAMRDAKSPSSASFELLDKLYEKLGGDDAIRIEGTAKVDVRQQAGDGKAVAEGNAAGGEAAAQGEAAAGNGEAKVKLGRTKGTTDDRHTIGPPNEVGELLPYTRSLSQARDSGIFGEKQWWQDLAWAVRNPETKIGKELLENGKVTDEQVGLAIARDERYVRSDALLEEMRVKREEALRDSMLADAQPEKAREILKAKDLVNIFGGDEGDYFMRKGDKAALNAAIEAMIKPDADYDVNEILRVFQKAATRPAEKQILNRLLDIGLDTTITRVEEDRGRILAHWRQGLNSIEVFNGGADPVSIIHETIHAASVSRIDAAYAMMDAIQQGTLKRSQLTEANRRLLDAGHELLDLFQDAVERDTERKHYGSQSPYEFIAEALSNPEFQQFLGAKTEPKSLFRRFTDWVKKLLGMPVESSKFEDVMRISEELLGKKPENVQTGEAEFQRGPAPAAQQTDRVLQRVASLGDAPLSIKQGFTRAHLYAATLNHISQVFDSVLPKPYRGATKDLGAAQDRAKMIVEARNRDTLELSREMADVPDANKLYRLMGEASRFGISPDLPIEKQPWAAKKANPELIRKYNELKAIYESSPEIKSAFDKGNEANKADYASMYATLLRNIARYSDMPRELWKPIDVTKGRSNEVQALEQWLLTQGSEEQRAAVRGALAQYREKQQGPYFHLGRNGSYFTRFTIADTPAARAAYEKEFGVSPLATERVIAPEDRHVFARYEAIGEWKGVSDRLNKLMAAGHLEPEMQSGQLETMLGKLDASSPSFIRGLLRNIESDPRYENTPEGNAERQQAMDVLRRMAIEMLPETSASKAFAQRKGVAGYDVDMNRSFVKRAASTAYFIAHNSIRPEVEDAMLKLKQGVQALQNASSEFYNNDKGLVASALHDEIKQRQANELLPVKTPIMDNVSALSHSFYLAANPAFFMMKTLQPWQLALPQLGARHGFVRSFGAMTKATATALGIIRDTIGDGWQRGQWKGILDPNIVIDKSRATIPEKAFLKSLIEAGGATFTQAHDMGAIAAGESPNITTAVKFGNASLHYSEALDRMTAGLAAFNLEMKRTGDTEKATQYGIQMVKNSLFDYNTHNRGRMFSKQGMFGPATPLLTQFAQYQIQTLELMGRLSMDAFGKLDATMTPAERQAALAEKGEARRALGGLMATTMVLAGSLGLPATSVLTAAYNGIFSTKDNPADAQSDYRNFLADTFGKDAGEIIAHGALRAAGTDLGASHLGFQDIVPFSRFLNDRRKLQDRFDSGALNMMGPAVGAASGFAYGIQNMMQGRYMKGLEQMLPSGLKGVAKAYDLEENGLTNLQGNKLPVEINSWDIFNQLLNSTPAKVAEQHEAQRGAGTTSMLLKQRSIDLKENFAVAAERGDGQTMKTLTEQITEFNRQNPDFAVRDLTGILRQRALDRAVAEQTSVTGKVKQLPRLAADSRFANVRGMP